MSCHLNAVFELINACLSVGLTCLFPCLCPSLYTYVTNKRVIIINGVLCKRSVFSTAQITHRIVSHLVFVFVWCNCNTSYLVVRFLYPPLQQSWKGGILVSPCPSVRLSVCGQNRVRSVSSTILIGSISYLHILSSNFRRCVACNARFKIQKFDF